MFNLNKYREDHADLYEFAEKINECNEIELLDFFNTLEFNNDNTFYCILQMIAHFTKQRPISFNKMTKFLLNISDEMKTKFSEEQISNAFKMSSQALLDFLYDQKIVSKRMTEESTEDNQIYTSFYIQNLEAYFDDENEIEQEKEEKPNDEKDGYNSIRKVIQNDDIDSFQNFISRTNENINSNLQKSSQILNTFEKQCQKYIEYAAFFGSLHIFKFLWLNNAVVTENLFPLSIFGGDMEIIHLIESKIISDSNYSQKIESIMNKAATAAVFCFRHELLEYLCDNYSITFEYAALYQSLISFNLPDLLFMIEANPMILNSYSDDLRETIFHNPNHFTQYDVIKFILSNYLYKKYGNSDFLDEKESEIVDFSVIEINVDSTDTVVL